MRLLLLRALDGEAPDVQVPADLVNNAKHVRHVPAKREKNSKTAGGWVAAPFCAVV
jgi:hypothetical protein